MLVRITWALVVAALGTLIGSFFTADSNVLLFIAIGLAVCVILLLAVSWTRRAREASTYGVQDELAFAKETETAEEEEDLFARHEADEDKKLAVGGRRPPRRTRRAVQHEAKAAPARKPKAKQAAKTAGARKAQTGGARKSKPTTSKAKPPRRRASAE